jgi:hypothetical protein
MSANSTLVALAQGQTQFGILDILSSHKEAARLLYTSEVSAMHFLSLFPNVTVLEIRQHKRAQSSRPVALGSSTELKWAS